MEANSPGPRQSVPGGSGLGLSPARTQSHSWPVRPTDAGARLSKPSLVGDPCLSMRWPFGDFRCRTPNAAATIRSVLVPPARNFARIGLCVCQVTDFHRARHRLRLAKPVDGYLAGHLIGRPASLAGRLVGVPPDPKLSRAHPDPRAGPRHSPLNRKPQVPPSSRMRARRRVL